MLKGITGRWLKNSILPLFIFITIIVVVLAFSVRSYYYSSIQNILTSRATVVSNFYSLQAAENSDIYSCFRSIMDNYDEKHTAEMFLLDQTGAPLLTSSGFFSEESFPSEDFLSALESEENQGVWIGSLPQTGEQVMAVTNTLYDENGRLVGAVRLMVSLTSVNITLTIVVIALIIAGLIILISTVSSGNYFIRSIVHPVNDIAAITKRISMGDYEARIDKPYDDEIGDLCDAINYMASELSAADKVKNDFISSVSHELRTPLTSIKGWGETMMMAADDEELIKKGMGVIVGETNRLSGMVEDLLDFSRLQSGRLKMNMAKTDIIAELQDAVLMFKQRALTENKIIDFSEPAEPISPVIADGARIKQVFINIIDNAIKYTGDGGLIKIGVAQMNNHIQVTVSDNGCGISDADMARIREKFYKANFTQRGAGIGLAICDEIIQQHSGIMNIESVEGKGTVIMIAIPIDQPSVLQKKGT